MGKSRRLGMLALTLFLGLPLFTPAIAVAQSTVVASQTSFSNPLEEAMVLAAVDQFYPELQMARIEARKASAKRLEKQGTFDPKLEGRSEWARYNSSSDAGKAQDIQVTDVAVTLPTRFGASLSAGYMVANGDVKTPYSPTGGGGEAYWGLRLPLLQGAWFNTASVAERQALLGERWAEQLLAQKRLAILNKALQAYWQWVAAVGKYRIEQDLLALADFRVGAIQKRATAGDLPTIAVTEAQQELALRQGRLVRAERDVQEKAFKLNGFLWQSADTLASTPQLTQAPMPLLTNMTAPPVTAVEEGKLTALQKRPELQALSLTQSVAKLERSLARNLLLPKVDGYIQQGFETGSKSVSPTFRAGVSVSVPLRYRKQLGELRQAELELEKLTAQQRWLMGQVFIEVMDSVSFWGQTVAQATAAEAEVSFAQTVEAGERKRFELGDSTLFMVNQRERFTAEARQRFVDVLAQSYYARTLYQVVTNTL